MLKIIWQKRRGSLKENKINKETGTYSQKERTEVSRTHRGKTLGEFDTDGEVERINENQINHLPS